MNYVKQILIKGSTFVKRVFANPEKGYPRPFACLAYVLRGSLSHAYIRLLLFAYYCCELCDIMGFQCLTSTY